MIDLADSCAVVSVFCEDPFTNPCNMRGTLSTAGTTGRSQTNVLETRTATPASCHNDVTTGLTLALVSPPSCMHIVRYVFSAMPEKLKLGGGDVEKDMRGNGMPSKPLMSFTASMDAIWTRVAGLPPATVLVFTRVAICTRVAGLRRL